MKNIDRLTQHIVKNGSKNMLIHTIYGTSNWIICTKIEKNKWLIALANPMGNITHNLGIVNNQQHLLLWEQLTRREINKKATQIILAKQLRTEIKMFIKNYPTIYKNFINQKYETKRLGIKKLPNKHNKK